MSSVPSDSDSQFELRLITPATDLQALAHLIAQTFAQNPFEVSLNITADMLAPSATAKAAKAAREGLSHVVLERATGKLIAFSICEDVTTEERPGPEILSHPAFGPLYGMREELRFTEKVPRGEVVRGSLAGTLEGFEGHGMFVKCTNLSTMEAAAKGFKRMVVTTRHPRSQKSALLTGYTVVKTVDVATFQWPPGSGVHPFKHLAKTINPTLVSLDLTTPEFRQKANL